VPSQLSIYLRNHEAAARAGLDLIRRTASSQRRRPYGEVLRQLLVESQEDLDALHGLMRRLDVKPDPVLGTALRLGERVGRLKPNGHLVRRAPLSDLVEVEGVLSAVQLKAAGWRSLVAAGVADRDELDVVSLVGRAERQVERLAEVHRQAALSALSSSSR
jgi:hypothetical protein